MDLQEVIAQEYKRIDESAATDKKAIDYMAGIAQQYESTLSEALKSGITSSSPYAITPEDIYKITRLFIRELDKEADPMGVRFERKIPLTPPPLIRLGWLKLVKSGEENPLYLKVLTEEGIKVLDGLRAIYGSKSAREQREEYQATIGARRDKQQISDAKAAAA